MKKYSSLVLILVAGVAFSVKSAEAMLYANTNTDTQINVSTKGASLDTSADTTNTVVAGDEKYPTNATLEQSQIKARADLKANIETMRTKAKADMTALKAQIKTEKDNAKAKMEEVRISSRENALSRFDLVVGKLTDLDARVSAQITKLKAKSVDVTIAASFETTVASKLANVKVKIADANTLLSTSANELTADQKTTVKATVKDIQTLLNDAHTALNNAIQSLRESMKAKLEARASANTNTSTNEETNQ